jgi:predicted P-loop ATPase
VREWLDTLEWDREPRIAQAFTDHWGAEPTVDQPPDYLEAASRNFLIGMVARVLRPGCKLDTMPVFEGAQGIFKSSALAVLAGANWHTTAHESVTSKDFFQSLPGKWIIEIAELDSFSRAEVNRVKSVMSTPVDRYRASYGRTASDHPRQCVFAGTVNQDNWGKDETGLRRFWPVTCGAINLQSLSMARDQLFAEARDAFVAGEGWWAMPSSTRAVQAARQQESAISDIILPWLVGKSETTVADVCQGPMKLDGGRIGRGHELEVGRVLRLAGWHKHNVRRDGAQAKRWVAPGWMVASTGDVVPEDE